MRGVVARERHTDGQTRDDAGAILILAMVYLIVIAVTVAALSTWALNDLNNTTHFSTARSRAYAASAATDVAISSVRTTPVAGTPTAPVPCWGNAATSSLSTGTISMDVWCSTVTNLASPATRVVTISTCLSSLGFSGPMCVGDHLLQAVVTYDDYPSGGGPLLTQTCQTCGYGATLNAWNWEPSEGQSSITWTSASPAAAIVGGASYTPAASATSGLPVSFTLDALSVGCTLFGGVVNFTAVGTCIIDANQAGNANWIAATQVQQSITVVSLGVTALGNGIETTSATSVSSSTNITAPIGPTVLLLAAYEATAGQTCNGASGSALSGFNLIANNAWYSTGGNYAMCAYSATGTGAAGTASISFTGAVHYASLQVIEISGYNNAFVGLSASNLAGSANTTPITNLGGTPSGQGDEVIFGDLTNSSVTPPAWSTTSPSTFTRQLTSTMSQGTNTYNLGVYFGKALSSVAGAFTGGTPATANWGTIGIEVDP